MIPRLLVVLLLAVVHPVLAEPGISIHLVPADQGPCSVDGATLTCDDLDHRGDPTVAQHAYVVVSGVEFLWTVQFGINYDPGVEVGRWESCLAGIEHAVREFPSPDSAVGIVWGHCLDPRGPEDLIVLGYMEILPGSWGRIWITDYEPTRGAEIEACSSATMRGRPERVVLRPDQLGMARVHGTHAGRVVCHGSAD
jgi:hypothetical protein